MWKNVRLFFILYFFNAIIFSKNYENKILLVIMMERLMMEHVAHKFIINIEK